MLRIASIAALSFHMIAPAIARPTIAVHPATAFDNDEVFVAYYDYGCGQGALITREKIATGWRLRVPVDGSIIPFMGQYPCLCLQSLGVLSAGLHELVPVTGCDHECSRPIVAAIDVSTIAVSPGKRPPEIDTWMFVASTMNSLSLGTDPARLLRLSGNRFVALPRIPDRDYPTLFDLDPANRERIDAGLPAAMKLGSIHVDLGETCISSRPTRSLCRPRFGEC